MGGGPSRTAKGATTKGSLTGLLHSNRREPSVRDREQDVVGEVARVEAPVARHIPH